MFYIIMFIKAFVLEYFIILSHEVIHYFISCFYGFKISFFHVIPFTIYKKNSKISFSFRPRYEQGLTSRIHYDSITLNSSLSYRKLNNKLRVILFAGPIFDFTIFVILFVLGISLYNSLFLAITAILHFFIASITFFNSDGKYAIGSKEDPRICFNLINSVTLCGNGVVNDSSKRIMTDKYLEISNSITWEGFEVNDLWNFTNNIDFYTNSLCSYLNKDLLILDKNIEVFTLSLISDFDKISYLDYRQTTKTSKSIILYYIYKKLLDINFSPEEVTAAKVLKDCKSNYYRELYSFYFNNYTSPQTLEFLSDEYKMPIFCRNCLGYSKLFYNLISNKNKI